MINNWKSCAKVTVLTVLCLPLFLTACADIRGPQWLTGEPSPDELVHKRVVRKPQLDAESSWPRLADVPEVKPTFSSPRQRALIATDMMSDRLQADAEKVQIHNVNLYGRETEPEENRKVPFSFSALGPDSQ